MTGFRGDTLVLDGIRHHVLRHGTEGGSEGPPLLLLHGFMASGGTWRRVADALGAHHVVMPDARGHGGSARAPDGVTFGDLAADAAGLIEALELDRPVVVGHSMGAATAATLAAERPERLRALVLVDPGMREPPPPPAPGTPAYESWYRPFLATLATFKTQTPDERRRSYLDFYPPAARWHPDDVARMADAHAELDPSLIEHPPSLPLDGLVAAVARVNAPTLLLTGDPDRGGLATEEGIEAIRSSLGDGRHVRLDAGHLLPFEAFDAFVAALRRFLDEVAAGA